MPTTDGSGNNNRGTQPPHPPNLNARRRVNMSEAPIDIHNMLSNSNFPSVPQRPEGSAPPSPAARLMELIMYHDDEAAREQLDNYLMGYYLHRTPMHRIAEQLDVDIKVARSFMRDYKKRMREKIEKLEPTHLMADSMDFYKYTQAKLMDIFDKPNATILEKALAYDRMAKGQRDMLKMLEINRYYERKGFAPKESDDFEPRRQSNYLKNMMENILRGNPIEDDLYFQEKTVDVEFDEL